MNCYSPNFQGFILMKNALNNQVGMLGDMFLWLVANLKQGGIYFIKQALPPNKSAGSVCMYVITYYRMMMNTNCFVPSGSFVLLFWHLLAKYQVIWPNTSTQFLCFNLKICMYLYVLGGNDVRNKSNIWLSIGRACEVFQTKILVLKIYHKLSF